MQKLKLELGMGSNCNAYYLHGNHHTGSASPRRIALKEDTGVELVCGVPIEGGVEALGE